MTHSTTTGATTTGGAHPGASDTPADTPSADEKRHSSHWGAFLARDAGGGRLAIRPSAEDPDPSPILRNFEPALRHPSRPRRPLVRRGWLERGPGPDPARGAEEFIEIPWDEALDLAAAEMRRLGAAGPATDPAAAGAVFGGSYGWASAGRFHHAQSQAHRFLNTAFGGYVASVDTYSSGAGSAILAETWGPSFQLTRDRPIWAEIETQTELLLAFGGLPVRNTAISGGGMSRHGARASIDAAAARGARIVSISPIADDMQDAPGLTRIAPRPGTDTALMLGMAHRLLTTGRVDRAHLSRATLGFDALEAYIRGADGTPKTPDWAARICGVPAEIIITLADAAAAARTLINVTYSLQRAENGEQPVWMALALSAMLGGDAPGAGFSYGLGSIGAIGNPALAVPLPTLPQGRNACADFIPVARIADMLLNPGDGYIYRGAPRAYPDIRLILWSGGNPFHHHQDLSRLAEAFTRPDTIILTDPYATAAARHCDLFLPATLSLERTDIGAAGADPYLHAMQPLAAPEGARDDFAIFSALADRLGCGPAFHENRSAAEWLAHLYAPTQKALAAAGHPAPAIADLLEDGMRLTLPTSQAPGRLARFHEDPEAHPLPNPTGRIALHCPAMAAAGLPPHPAWIEPLDWLGGPLAARRPFQLIANQPAGRLHSQLDFGPASAASKIAGREAARLNPADAERLGLTEGDPVLLRSDRGACIAAARPDPAIPPEVIQLSTGAWHAPVDLPGLGPVCVNGNPNALTHDRGASAFSGGCAGQLTLVSAEPFPGAPPPIPHEALLRKAPR